MRIFAVPILALALLLSGCASKTTTATTPASPQLTIAQIDKTALDANGTMLTTIRQLRANGTMTAADVATIEQFDLAVVLPAIQGVATELGSADTWVVQKTKLITMLATVTAPAAVVQAYGRNSSAAAVVATVLTLAQAILTAVNAQ